MTSTKYSTAVIEKNRPLDLMISEHYGQYLFHRPVTENEIVKLAKNLLEAKIINQQSLNGSEIVKDFCITQLTNEQDEIFGVIFLNNNLKFIAFEKLFHGTINKTKIYPRTVIRAALKYNASHIILMHNHPSGNLTFSDLDIKLTKKLKDLLIVLDIQVIDHILVGHGNAKSMGDEMLIQF